MRKLFLIITLTITFYTLYATRYPLKSYANNIDLYYIQADAVDTVTGTLRVKFDISWENAWKDATNQDAAWVFMKYSLNNGITWNHCTLKASGTNPAGFYKGSLVVGGVSKNLDIYVPTNKKGAFLQIASADTGSGTLTASGVGLVWDYTADGVTLTGQCLIKVFAIEMVWIPTTAFYYGGTGTAPKVAARNAFYIQHPSGYKNYAPYIISEAQTFTSAADWSDIICAGCGGAMSSSFPRAYNGFYIMKYEISQGQYRDFLNTLTLVQQATRTADTRVNYYTMSGTDAVIFRQGIRVPSALPTGTTPITFGCDLSANGTFDESSDGEWIACNYLSWMDGAAYAAWAALRPMAETEFEKGCNYVVSMRNQYAWGNSTITQVTSISSGGTISEVGGNVGEGLCVYGSHASVQGPLRSGFAATASTSARANAGAGYYGCMDLSGNLWERAVSVGDATSRMFTAAPGTGLLSGSGNAIVNGSWPGCVAGGTEVSSTAVGFRGGSWVNTGTGPLYMFARDYMYSTTAVASPAYRDSSYGFRCVRSYP